jgi:hypothetical protein
MDTLEDFYKELDKDPTYLQLRESYLKANEGFNDLAIRATQRALFGYQKAQLEAWQSRFTNVTSSS